MIEVILLIVLPLLWGLGVEYVFEWFRRKKGSVDHTPGDA